MSCVIAYKDKTKQVWISDGCIISINNNSEWIKENGFCKIFQLKPYNILIGFSGSNEIFDSIQNRIKNYNFTNATYFIRKISKLTKYFNEFYCNELLDHSTVLIIGGSTSSCNFLYVIESTGRINPVKNLAIIGDGTKYINEKVKACNINKLTKAKLIDLFKECWKSPFCNKEMFIYHLSKKNITNKIKTFK